MPRWSPCSIRGKSQGKLRKPVRSAFDQANCDSRQKALKSISDSDLRRVSEWLAATLEMSCRVTGCGFESHAIRSDVSDKSVKRPRVEGLFLFVMSKPQVGVSLGKILTGSLNLLDQR